MTQTTSRPPGLSTRTISLNATAGSARCSSMCAVITMSKVLLLYGRAVASASRTVTSALVPWSAFRACSSMRGDTSTAVKANGAGNTRISACDNAPVPTPQSRTVEGVSLPVTCRKRDSYAAGKPRRSTVRCQSVADSS